MNGLSDSPVASRIGAPCSLDELERRARALAGRSLGELARQHTLTEARGSRPVHTKGHVGLLVEQLLGATGGSGARHDFPELGVELKTVPLDERGRARESTFVCTVSLLDAERAEWETSWTRAKLSHVLWVPVLGNTDEPIAMRRFGMPRLWRPTREQDAIFRSDFDEILGTIGCGGIEGVTARLGRWLQLRPKARNGAKTAVALGRDGEWIATVPRGFYLRARFTSAILRESAACPI